MTWRTRLVAALIAALTGAATLTGCETDLAGTKLRIGGGVAKGVYADLANGLAEVWPARTGIDKPVVEFTAGSPDNMNRLVNGDVDVAFSAADVAADRHDGPNRPMALARVHDDYLHVVVREDSDIRTIADLTGKRVSIGGLNSGVAVIAKRVLKVAGVTATEHSLGLDDSIEAFVHNGVDAFFWSGGLPTAKITLLATRMRLRLIDLSDSLPRLRSLFPVYYAASIPASTYNLAGPGVDTLAVPNYLLATDKMSDDLAEALVRGMFDGQQDLIKANRAALSIDVHSAIETDPIPLHPGALRYYRDSKI